MWGLSDADLSGRWDWASLRAEVLKHGVRNSLLLAPMPTASTSQILGNNECFEPYTSNLYVRRTLSGEFVVVNKHLMKDLIALGLWDDDMKQEIMRSNGSVQHIEVIPEHIRELYKTTWEMSMRDIIDMAADRGVFIDQSQSLNMFMENANVGKLTSMHFYAWKKGLKTGMYYLRTKAAQDAIKFTVKSAVSKPSVEPTPTKKEPVVLPPKVPPKPITPPAPPSSPMPPKPPTPPVPVAPVVQTPKPSAPTPNVGMTPTPLRKEVTTIVPAQEKVKSDMSTQVPVDEKPKKPTSAYLQEQYAAGDMIACSIESPEDCLMCGS